MTRAKTAAVIQWQQTSQDTKWKNAHAHTHKQTTEIKNLHVAMQRSRGMTITWLSSTNFRPWFKNYLMQEWECMPLFNVSNRGNPIDTNLAQGISKVMCFVVGWCSLTISVTPDNVQCMPLTQTTILYSSSADTRRDISINRIMIQDK